MMLDSVDGKMIPNNLHVSRSEKEVKVDSSNFPLEHNECDSKQFYKAALDTQGIYRMYGN